MWFKNLQAYKLEEFNLDKSALEQALREKSFHPCPSMLPFTTGWVPPYGTPDEQPLVREAFGFMLITLKIEEKIIPSAALRERLNKRVDEIQNSQERKISSKEKSALRDDILSDMVTKALTKSSTVSAIIDTKNMMLIVDAASRNKAEEFCTSLRKTLGTLSVSSPISGNAGSVMTKWLKLRELPSNLLFGEKCSLSQIDEQGTLVCAKQDILSDEISAFLKHSTKVKNMQLVYKEFMKFVLKDDFSITGVKFHDVIIDLAHDDASVNPEMDFDASFIMTANWASELVSALITELESC